MWKFKDKYFTNSFKGLLQYSWHEWIALHCIYSSVTEDDQSQPQAFKQFCQLRSSKVGPLSLPHGVTSGCCLQKKKGCQFPLSRRPQWPASFGCVWARMDSLCVACAYMQWFTCGGTKTRKQFGVCTPAHALGLTFFTKTTNQNWSKCNFHFCYSEGKLKTATLRNFILCLSFLKAFLKQDSQFF